LLNECCGEGELGEMREMGEMGKNGEEDFPMGVIARFYLIGD
jgi:hypothetical protein